MWIYAIIGGMSDTGVKRATFATKVGLAKMLCGGVIMDVSTPEQAKIAESAGAQSVMALERIPADIRTQGGVARMSDPALIKKIQDAVTIPVMAKCRIGHTTEAQILQALEVDYIDESEVLTPADTHYHIDKAIFDIPFVCGCRTLGEALRRIAEGAALIRCKGEAGTGDIAEAVRHMQSVRSQIAQLRGQTPPQLIQSAKEMGAPFELVRKVAKKGALPVPLFSAGGVATPADAALMVQLGAEAVFVGSGIFKSNSPERFANAIVEAVTYYDNPKKLARISEGLGKPMFGIVSANLPDSDRLSVRGW